MSNVSPGLFLKAAAATSYLNNHIIDDVSTIASIEIDEAYSQLAVLSHSVPMTFLSHSVPMTFVALAHQNNETVSSEDIAESFATRKLNALVGHRNTRVQEKRKLNQEAAHLNWLTDHSSLDQPYSEQAAQNRIRHKPNNKTQILLNVKRAALHSFHNMTPEHKITIAYFLDDYRSIVSLSKEIFSLLGDSRGTQLMKEYEYLTGVLEEDEQRPKRNSFVWLAKFMSAWPRLRVPNIRTLPDGYISAYWKNEDTRNKVRIDFPREDVVHASYIDGNAIRSGDFDNAAFMSIKDDALTVIEMLSVQKFSWLESIEANG